VLILQRNVAAGLVVHPAVIGRRLALALPFLVTEEIILAGVRRGGDRQDLHERIRVHALAARERLDEGSDDNDFFDRVASDSAFGTTREALAALADPARLVGRAPDQVRQYLDGKVAPLLAEGATPTAAEEVRV